MSIITASCWSDTALFIITVGLFIYLFYQRQFQYWSKKNIAHTTPEFLFGDMRRTNRTRSFGLVFSDIYNQGKGHKIFGFWKLYSPAVIIRDLQLIRNVLIKDFNYFHDRGVYLDEEVEPLAGHLFLLTGQKWKHLRSKLSPTFTSGKMKMMFPAMVNCGKVFQGVLEIPAKNRDVIEVKELLARFTTDIIGSCAFGIEVNCLLNPDVKFRQLGRQLFHPNAYEAVKNLILFTFPGLFNTLKVGLFPKHVRDFFTGLVSETMEYREKNNVTRTDFLQLLMDLKNKGYVDGDGVDVKPGTVIPDDEKFTLTVATAQAFVFFVAGFETSSTTMQFALYELARNQQVQQLTREEILNVLKKYDGEITYDGIQEMDYLDRVVSETLRMYPPAPLLLRQVTRDYQLPGSDTVLEKGTDVAISLYGLHHDPEYYPNPENFDPERFTAEGKAKRDHCAYMPFGEGPRQCIGMRFGLMQTKVGLVTLLSKFKFEVCEQTQIPMVLNPRSNFTAALGGVYLRISSF